MRQLSRLGLLGDLIFLGRHISVGGQWQPTHDRFTEQLTLLLALRKPHSLQQQELGQSG